MKNEMISKRGGKFSMKKRVRRLQAVFLALVMLLSVFQGIPGVKFLDYGKKVEAAENWVLITRAGQVTDSITFNGKK